MLKKLIIDSSTLIALERVKLLHLLNNINYEIEIPKAVYEETKIKEKRIKVVALKGKTLKISRTLERLGFGKGESQCIALARKYNLNFILCDDMKVMRKLFFLNNKDLRNMKILGFSFFLHHFSRKKLIKNIWSIFEIIILNNKWERSEVQVSNYTFLKELGY
ncbi:hypothetical protein HYW75_03990 [Candidatus Pacearchaeota archaeon]|nr:hypothetical protein [Candidatus Pacearchaeota archaeon]